MRQKTRNGVLTVGKDEQDLLLGALYGCAAGRLLLKPLTAPWLSKLAGRFLSTKASKIFIEPFIRNNVINMLEYERVEYGSFNDFFSRRIRPGMRPVDMDPEHLISPADSKLTALPITENGRFTLKHTEYTVGSLLKDPALASEYVDGWALIFRLTVDDYHRYCYAFDAEKGENVVIPGRLHTVNPIAKTFSPSTRKTPGNTPFCAPNGSETSSPWRWARCWWAKSSTTTVQHPSAGDRRRAIFSSAAPRWCCC